MVRVPRADKRGWVRPPVRPPFLSASAACQATSHTLSDGLCTPARTPPRQPRRGVRPVVVPGIWRGRMWPELLSGGRTVRGIPYFQIMAQEGPSSDSVFEVDTPLGFRVRVTRATWDVLVRVKHPVMAGQESGVHDAVAAPDQVRVSRSAHDVYLFYKAVRVGRWNCAVCKRQGSGGFLIAA
jgi:hypothetical protein